MKTLTLIRHAKSDKSDLLAKDFDRWLCEKWEKQIKIMWKLLKDIWFKTDLIICSKARRAMLTLNWLKSFYKKLDVDTKFKNDIYDFHMWSYHEMINFLKEIEDKKDDITIIGHNSIFDEAINYFLNLNWFHISTLWIIKIEFDIKKWKDINNNWKLVYYLSPKI